MRFTVQPPLVNYTPTTRQWEIQNSLFWTPADWFFPDFLRALLKHGSSYRGSNFIEMIWGETKLLRVSGRFELSRVRVTEGKITVNVWRKSRGNRFWFELARVRVIESQLYRGCAFSTTVMENRPIVYDKIAEDVATFKAKLRTFLLRKYFR